jgi:hypothetical protein
MGKMITNLGFIKILGEPYLETSTADIIKAFGAGGLRLTDDSDTLGVFVEDGGQVGINEAAPDYPLQVTGVNAGADVILLCLQNDTVVTSSGAGIRFVASTDPDNAGYGVSEIIATRDAPGNSDLLFKTRSSNDGYVTTLKIDYEGNVIQSLRKFMINETVNTKMTHGITINQSSRDDEILAFKSSDVDHAGTNVTEADTYGFFQKIQAGTGGLFMVGVSEGAPNKGIEMVGLVTTNITTKDNNADGCVNIRGGKIVGGSIGSNDANANLLTVQDSAATRWIIDQAGATWQSGLATMVSLMLGTTPLSESDLGELTEAGQTALHSHAAGGGDLLADGSIPMTADWPFGNYALYIGDFVNTKMTIGLTINQGESDDECIALKSSDVAHGMTTETETDTYGILKKVSNTAGGLRIHSFIETGSPIALLLRGIATDEETDKGSTKQGAVFISGALRSGGSFGSLSANANILCVANNGAVVFTVDADGDTWQSGRVFIGDSVNTKMTLGITINQGANDDEAIALKSSDVAHGITDKAETDTYGLLMKEHADHGGLKVRGYSDDINTSGITIQGVIAHTDPTWAPINMSALKKSGTTHATLAAGEAMCLWQTGGTQSMMLMTGGLLFLGNEAVNIKMTVGLTINQGANDDEIMAFKSSDVDHGMTDSIETDTWGMIAKVNAGSGGMRFIGIVDSGDPGRPAIEIRGLAEGNADTTKSIIGRAIFESYCTQSSGTGYGNVVANGNIVAFRSRYAGASQTRWILDTHGKTWQEGSLTIGSQELTRVNLTALLDGGETALHSHAGGGGGFEYTSYVMVLMTSTMSNLSVNTNHKILFDNVVTDIGDDFDTDNNWFVAPADGYYYFAASGLHNQVDLATGFHWDIKTSNKSYDRYEDTWKWDQDGAYWPRYQSLITWMDEGDTAYANFYQQGQAAQTDIYVGGTGTWFICARMTTA